MEPEIADANETALVVIDPKTRQAVGLNTTKPMKYLINTCLSLLLLGLTASTSHAQTYPYLYEYNFVGQSGFYGALYLNASSSGNGSSSDIGPGSYIGTPRSGGPIYVTNPIVSRLGWNSNSITSLTITFSTTNSAQVILMGLNFDVQPYMLYREWDWASGGISDIGSGNWVASSNLSPVNITTQPLNQIVSFGSSVSFVVSVNGFPVPTFQWRLNGTNLPGATSNVLFIEYVQLTHLGVYSVEVNNGYGFETSSNATLTMLPSLVSPFTGLTSIWGQDATLAVGAVGSGVLTYQWFKNGAPINGATNQICLIPSTQFTDAGFYSVVVDSLFGSVTNTPAQLVVNPAGVAIGMYPGITITGTVGYAYSIQSAPNLTNTNGWITLTNLTLQQTPQLWFDSSINTFNAANPQRFYRVEPQ